MGRLQDNYNLGEQIYATESYAWDGKSRPNVNNYLSPWSKYANMEKVNSLYKKNRHLDSAINYAKTQLEAALAQYKDDLAFWNERDERDYTDQSSQRQRYEDAGFNMGYMYSSVDSGNSAVGYNQGDASLTPNDTSNKSVEQSKRVAEVVSGAFSLATNLVKSGYDIKLTDARSALADWQKIESMTRGKALSLQNQWMQILRSVDENGHDVGEDFSKSIAFLSEKVGYDLQSKELSRLSKFVEHCGDLYKNQSTDMVKELFGDFNEIIDSVDSNAVQIILRILAVMAVSGAQK